MRQTYILLLFTICLFSCQNDAPQSTATPSPFDQKNEAFEKDLAILKDHFNIPGMAACVIKDDQVAFEKYMGYADVEAKTPVDENTLFPIASLTKIYSATMIMKLVEEGKLSLDDPIEKYYPGLPVQEPIQVKHLLSHTSQGKVGEHFYYSGRFALLKEVIAQSANVSGADYLKETIIKPLNLENTLALTNDSLVNDRFAKPYYYDEAGKIETGFSPAAGIVSNLKDMITFNAALESNQLISEQSKNKMFQPFKEGLPYGLGIFTQKYQGVTMIWAYGQYDCYSSLFLKIPGKRHTLILLANNNLMSDPARLIYGDASYSLFVHSFLKNYIFDQPKLDILLDVDSLNSQDFDTELTRDKLLAQALASSFLARYDDQQYYDSKKALEAVFTQHPDYLDYGDLSLLHNLTFLKTVAANKMLEASNEFDEQIEQIGLKLLEEDPDNPYVRIYLGGYYDSIGDDKNAQVHYEQVANPQNFSTNWYTIEARNWLKSKGIQ